MKEFKIGQAVFLVTQAQITGLQVKGTSIIPATVVNQLSANVYNVAINESVGNRIIVTINSDVIHTTIKEASDQAIGIITSMLETEARNIKDLAKVALSSTSDCANVIFNPTAVSSVASEVEWKVKDIGEPEYFNLGKTKPKEVGEPKNLNLGESEEAKRRKDGLD